MAKIHGLAYIAVGLFISILSWSLDYQKLVFFFYAGLIFILAGSIKLIFGLIKRGMNKREIKHNKAHHQQFRYCTKCGSLIRLHDRFCSRCGAMV